jgi:hypothetical protein
MCGYGKEVDRKEVGRHEVGRKEVGRCSSTPTRAREPSGASRGVFLVSVGATILEE